jgi:hypothetical protein
MAERKGFGKKFPVFSLALLLAGCRPAGVENTAKPDIYITRTESYRTVEGDILWVLEYTIDGVVQSPGFNSQKAMTEFREYLDTIGKVYQREEE